MQRAAALCRGLGIPKTVFLAAAGGEKKEYKGYCPAIGERMKFDKRLLTQIKGVRAYLALTIGLSSLMGILIVMQAHFLSSLINGVFLASQALSQVQVLVLCLLAVIVVRAVLIWGSEVAASRVAGQVKTNLRERLFAKLFASGPGYTKGERSGELINTIVEGVESLDAYFSQYLPQLFLTILVPLIIVIAVFSVDVLSGLVLLLTAPVLPVFMILIGTMADAMTKKRWKLLSLMSAHFLDVLQGLTTLKLFGRSEAQKETIRRISDQYRHTTMKVLRIAFLSSLVLEMGATISTAIIAVEVGLRLLYGQISFQSAFFVLLLAPEFYLPLRSLGTRFHAAMTGFSSAQRIFEILETPIPTRVALSTQPVMRYDMENANHTTSIVTLAGSNIRFDNVYYTYDGQRPALKGVSFEIQPGQKVALVGPSGAGKSTVASLLLRFIEPNSGNVSVNGISLQDIPAQDCCGQISWVPQRPYLFNTTIAENIRLGCPEATLAEVVEAATRACAAEFISALPQRYDTVIGERGTRLSGGQAQRIALARAFLKDAPLLILDEPTAHLDAENERLVIEAIEQLVQRRTVLMIAHNLATVSKADAILVLEEGRIIETGNHSSLLELSGMYQRLVNAYSGVGGGTA